MQAVVCYVQSFQVLKAANTVDYAGLLLYVFFTVCILQCSFPHKASTLACWKHLACKKENIYWSSWCAEIPEVHMEQKTVMQHADNVLPALLQAALNIFIFGS